MWSYIIVEGTTKDCPGVFGASEEKDYTCYVSYSSIEENVTLIKEYFLYYCGFDYDKLNPLGRPPLDDHNCVCAIMTYYFRDESLLFDCKSHRFSCPREFPNRKPDKETEQYKVWVDVLKVEKITTPKSAAWMLYETVGNGKISIEYARDLVRKEFPEHIYSWGKIMNEFLKYGGAYTKKYLRRL